MYAVIAIILLAILALIFFMNGQVVQAPAEKKPTVGGGSCKCDGPASAVDSISGFPL